ncbi:MAG: hypothetical protein R6V85_07090 [Polyangia bacterium]
MRRAVEIMALVALAAGRVEAAGEAAGAAGDPGGGTVVWLFGPDDFGPRAIRSALRPLGELGLTIVVERVSGDVPDEDDALESLAVHRALAAAWNDSGGELQVLLAGAEGPERLSAEPGSLDEKAVYLRELLRSRLEGRSPGAELLVTAPSELVPEPLPPQLPVTRPRPPGWSPPKRYRGPAPGPRLGIGYLVRLHPDSTPWSQHGPAFHLPAWQLPERLVLRAIWAVMLPARIGDPGRTWLEISSFELSGAIGWVPLRRSRVDLELELGGGAVRTRCEAFLASGSSQSAARLTGRLHGAVGLVWHPRAGLDVRLHAGVTFVPAPASFGIGGEGHFGRARWRPTAGIDLSTALLGG